MNADPSSGDSARVAITPFWERVIGIFGVLLVLAAMAIITIEGLRADDAPSLLVRQEEIIAYEHGYMVKIQVINQGDTTAADVAVEGKVGSGDTGEVSTTTFDYIPPHSSRQGGLVFTQDPAADLHLRTTGFTLP